MRSLNGAKRNVWRSLVNRWREELCANDLPKARGSTYTCGDSGGRIKRQAVSAVPTLPGKKFTQRTCIPPPPPPMDKQLLDPVPEPEPQYCDLLERSGIVTMAQKTTPWIIAVEMNKRFYDVVPRYYRDSLSLANVRIVKRGGISTNTLTYYITVLFASLNSVCIGKVIAHLVPTNTSLYFHMTPSHLLYRVSRKDKIALVHGAETLKYRSTRGDGVKNNLVGGNVLYVAPTESDDDLTTFDAAKTLAKYKPKKLADFV